MKITTIFIIGFSTFVIGVLVAAIWFSNSFPSYVLNEVTVVRDQTDVDEQYEVYSVLIRELFVKDKSQVNSLNFLNQTICYKPNVEALKYPKENPLEYRVEELKRNYPSVHKDTLADYETKGLQPLKLQGKFNIPVRYKFVTEDEIEKSGGRAANNVIELSQVGFNDNRTQAFVNINYYCPLCGFGNRVFWRNKTAFG